MSGCSHVGEGEYVGLSRVVPMPTPFRHENKAPHLVGSLRTTRLTKTRSELPQRIAVIANTNVAKDRRVNIVTEYSYRTITQHAQHAARV